MENAFPATRQGLLACAAARYHHQPEYPWRDSPGHAVLRHPENRKWYAVVMDVPRQKLGLPGGGCVDIVNLKCDPHPVRVAAQPAGHPAGLAHEQGTVDQRAFGRHR